MSSSNTKGTPKDWLQELKGNRKTQVALLGFAATLGFVGYSLFGSGSAPKRPAGRKAVALPSRGNIDTQLTQLQPLINLAQLDRAGNLPNESRMFRDLFLFDGPPPPPPPVVPQPPPPPPTEAELAAKRLEMDRQQEEASKPVGLNYLGFFGTETSTRIAAFMKGEEPFNMPLGTAFSPKWKLVEITKDHALFQNNKYSDIKHKVQSKVTDDSQQSRQATNEF